MSKGYFSVMKDLFLARTCTVVFICDFIVINKRMPFHLHFLLKN